LNLLLFYVLAAVIVISAILVVTLRNVFHSALFLVLAFFMVAGVYLMLHAEFLAAVQVLIYVGAVTILMLFAIMLTHQIQSHSIRQVNEQVIPAALISALFLVLALFAMNKTFGHVEHPVHNFGVWTASFDVADLPDDEFQWNWTAVLEDKAGHNFLAAGTLFILSSPSPVSENIETMDLNAPSGYLLSPNPDFERSSRRFTRDQVINLKVWSDDVDYGALTSAAWNLTGATDPSKTTSLHLSNSNPETIGRLLMSPFVLPFEVVSVLLLVSLIGAIVISRKDA
jgi:NADH:ubiquinone oxidoreductase subunit 6 (subunit J)